MKIKIAYRRFIIASVVASLALAATTLIPSSGAETRRAAPPPRTTFGLVSVAPPSPVFETEERRAELVERRARVAQQIGANGVLVLFSAEPRIYSNSVDYEYRQENYFYYLTHLKQKGATLVIMPGNSGAREILFLPRRNPVRETWDGYMYSAEDARRLSGVTEIWEDRQFEPFVQALKNNQPFRPEAGGILLSPPTSGVAGTTEGDAAGAAQPVADAALYLLVPPREAESGEFGDHREWKREQRFASEWKKSGNAMKIRSAMPMLAAMRLRKSPSELRRLQHAIDISTEAHGRAMALAGRTNWEYEVEAEVEYTFKRRNADYWGYPSIVGCGPNATTLHYNESQREVKRGELLLMDVGAEYDHYTADITRTFPVNGKFTPAQAEVYNIVLAAQEAGMRASKPGGLKDDAHDAATEVVKEGLLRLGLISDKNGTVQIEGFPQPVPQYRLWFMHGTSHWLGMNVHDVGDNNARLEPGMVYTIEPGIYVRGDALDHLAKTPGNEKFLAKIRPAFEKYKTIGVRIEDDVVITPDGHRNMSAALPRTVADIERHIALGSRQLKTVALGGLRPAAGSSAHARGVVNELNSLAGSLHDSLWQPATEVDFPSGQTARRGFVPVSSASAGARGRHAHGEYVGE